MLTFTSKKRLWTFLLILTLAVSWWALSPREPVYQGKQLTRWLSEAYKNRIPAYVAGRKMSPGFTSWQPEWQPDTMNAIRAMGTDALPTLVGMMSANETHKWKLLQLFGPTAQDLKAQATFGFCALGTNAASMINPLMMLFMKDHDINEAIALANIGPGGVVALSQALTNQTVTNVFVRSTLLGALGIRATKIRQERGARNADPIRLELETEAMLPSLCQCLGDRAVPIRSQAADVLVTLGVDQAKVIPVLVQCLDDKDTDVRWRAAKDLEAIGPAVEEAIPALLNVLENDSNASVRAQAARALYAITPSGPTASVAAASLLKALDDKSAWVRREAARSLARFASSGKASAEIISALVKAMADNDPTVRVSVSHAIRNIRPRGDGAALAIPALERASRDQNPAVRSEATEALRVLKFDPTAAAEVH